MREVPVVNIMNRNSENSEYTNICAFNKNCYMLGYGGGFYDRYFEKRKDICRIAAAYEMQIVEEIETEEFDLPADYVTTEERFW